MKKLFLICSVCALLLISGVFFSRQNENRIQLSNDIARVKRQISKLIPVGSDAKQAKIVMENNGFACLWKRGEFATFSGEHQITHPTTDFLYCDRERGWITHERWQVAITHESSRVTDIRVSYGIIAP